MNLTRFATPTVLAAALALTATPAAAQHRSGARASRGAVSHGTVSRGAISRAPMSRGAISRGQISRGTFSRGVAIARSAPAFRGSFNRGRVVVRGGVLPRGGYYYRPYYSGYYSYRPFYSFRPHISLGIGLWAGYPISWSAYFGYGYPYYDYPYYNGYYPSAPYYYGSPYPYYPPSNYDDPPSSSSNYPPPDNSGYNGSSYPQQSYPQQSYPQQPQQSGGTVAVQPGSDQQAASGGVSFEITPSDASVFVDGTYMGKGSEFGPTTQPLGLSVGRHHVEIRAEGYKTMSFDADVTAGQITPYRATLQRQ